MSFKIAFLIDGGHFSKAIGKQLNPQVTWPTAKTIYENALKFRAPDETLFRIFYYDSEPYTGIVTNPVDGSTIDCGASAPAKARNYFFSELGQMNYIALRRGPAKPRGWELRKDYIDRQKAGNLSVPTAADYQPIFEQKGVDMRIGMDVAALALKRLVDRIVICTGDTDLIPAMKLARREGLQVVLSQVGSWTPHKDLIEDSDLLRPITPQLY